MIVLKISNASEVVASKVGKFLEFLTPDSIDHAPILLFFLLPLSPFFSSSPSFLLSFLFLSSSYPLPLLLLCFSFRLPVLFRSPSFALPFS